MMARVPKRIAFGLLVCSVLVLVGGVGGQSAATSAEKLYKLEILSKAHTLDQIYPSMKGPSDTQNFELVNAKTPELIWLKSAQVDIVDSAGEIMSPEYLCHSNLYFNEFGKHQSMFSRRVTLDQKFVDVNQGQLRIEMPAGFGIPLMSTEKLRFHSMVINPTVKPEPFKASVKTTFEYLRDAELVGSIKALSQRAIRLRVPIALPKGHEHALAPPIESSQLVSEMASSEPDHANHSDHAGHVDHAGNDSDAGLLCDPVQETYEGQALTASATENVFKTEPEGPTWSVHWVVPPGRHEYRYKAEEGLRIPFDETTVHLITTHVHPYAESIELNDLTTGKQIFHTKIEYFDAIRGISNIPHYSSLEGLPVYKDHEYELVVVYNNTTGHDIDAMALLYLYYWDRNFARPTLPVSG